MFQQLISVVVILSLFSHSCSTRRAESHVPLEDISQLENIADVRTTTFSNDQSVFSCPTVDVDSRQFSMRNLRSHATSRPCCVSWKHGRVDCFIRSPRSTVLHKVVKMDDDLCKCSDWEDLGGYAVGEIECVSRDVGYIDIIVVGDNSALFVNSYATGSWTGWIQKGHYFYDVPSCSARDTSAIDCIVIDVKGRGFAIHAKDGVWGDATLLPVTGFLPARCVPRPNAETSCFSIGCDNLMYFYWFSQGVYKAWKKLGTGFKRGRPSVTTWGSERIDVFAQGRNNDIMLVSWTGASWQVPVSLGGSFDSDPECVSTANRWIYCFVIGHRSNLFKRVYDGIQWSGWANLYGSYMPEAPSCLVSDEKIISCYLRNTNHEIEEFNFDV